MDIGALDVSVMAGYPGTIAATWQRAGRAGRRASRSAAVMVASSAPLDQFIVRNPSYFFEALTRACADRSGQPAHPRRPREVRRIRTAVHAHGAVRATRRAGGPGHPRGAGARAPHRRQRRTGQPGSRRAVALDERILPGRRRQPALGVFGQLRDRRHDARAARDWRNRFHQRTVHPAREGHLHRRGHAVSGGEAGLRGAQGVRAGDRLRLLHGRDHQQPRDDHRYVL